MSYKYRLVFLVQVTRKYVMFSYLSVYVSLYTNHFSITFQQNYLGVVWLSLTGN